MDATLAAHVCIERMGNPTTTLVHHCISQVIRQLIQLGNQRKSTAFELRQTIPLVIREARTR